MHAAVTLAFGMWLSASTATDALKARDVEIRRALPPPEHTLTAGEKTKLEDLLTQAVDLPEMGKESLGKRWDGLSEAQRKKYLKAFSARFKKASEGEIDFYRNTEIAYAAETPNPDAAGEVQVPTTLTLKGEPTPVVYTVRNEDGAFKIVDITVDGVSTVENYRSSFGKVFDKEGIDGLVARLQKEPASKVGSK